MIRNHMILAAALVSVTGLAVRAATTLQISQAGSLFSEKAVSGAVGDTVVFLNDDTVRHNIRIIDDQDTTTDLGVEQPGERLTFALDKAGRFRVRCGIHPSMKMTITVK